MTRHAVAILTAVALAASASPALAHDGGLPPMPPLPHEPIEPDYEYGSHDVDREDWLEECRAEYPDEYSDEEYFDRCEPYPAPYEMGYRHGGRGPSYHYGHGCPACTVPMMMVPVKIKTRYVYSEPLRREKEVVVEEWIDEEVVQRKVVSRPRAASKVAPTSNGKTTRSR